VSEEGSIAPIANVEGAVDAVVERAASVLESGGLVVLPTDTVYGVGAAVNRPEGVARLYTAKGRPLDRPIPVLVSSLAAAHDLVTDIDPISRTLMERYWPGPLTIVLPAVERLPSEIVRDTGTVGLRMPDHPVALAIIERAGGALAVTSANRSDEPETQTAEAAAREIGRAVDLVVDGGVTPGGIPSTVVRAEGDDLVVLRQGAVSESELRGAISASGDVHRPPRESQPGSS
jgi:L-threonylcarbamoyladenylate synthase